MPNPNHNKPQNRWPQQHRPGRHRSQTPLPTGHSIRPVAEKPNPKPDWVRLPFPRFSWMIASILGLALFGLTLCGPKPLLAQDETGREPAPPRLDKKAELAAMRQINPDIDPPMPIDEERVRAAGIQKIVGRHLDLYTDIRHRPDIDELPIVFDQAVDSWCSFFSIDPSEAANWRMRAFIIDDEKRFKAARLMPDRLPKFLAGYQRGHEMWLYHQPGPYYTRHLLLHEGTHAFMIWFLRGRGSPWYSEGMAEMLAVHRWDQGKLEMNTRLRSYQDAPYWGRIKILQRDALKGKPLTLEEVFNIRNSKFLAVDAYAWSWAACYFLNHHPQSRDAFSQFPTQATLPSRQFNQIVRRALQKDWKALNRDWQLFVQEADYGYEVERGCLGVAAPIAGATQGQGFTIRADRSWQTTLSVRKGDRLKITSSGRFQIGKTDKPWPCESNGVTIDYYRGHPLGMLVAGLIDPDAASAKEQIAGLQTPIAVGLSREFEVPRDGILCFRVNESPARMDDNEGTLEVIVERLK